MAAIRETFVPIKDADVIEAEESALENVVTFRVLAINPPGERQQHFVEDRLQKCAVAFAGLFSLDLVNAPCCPGQDRRIHVVEIPFVSGDHSVRVLIPFPNDYIELDLGKTGVDQGEGETMKRQVPRGVP